MQHYGLGEACDDIASVLKRVAVTLRKTRKVKVLTGMGETGSPGLGGGWAQSRVGGGVSALAAGEGPGLQGGSCLLWKLQAITLVNSGVFPECAVQTPTFVGLRGLDWAPRGAPSSPEPPAFPGNVNVIQPDYPAAARDFLRAFRSGLLGPVMLDCDLLQGRSMEEEEP